MVGQVWRSTWSIFVGEDVLVDEGQKSGVHFFVGEFSADPNNYVHIDVGRYRIRIAAWNLNNNGQTAWCNASVQVEIPLRQFNCTGDLKKDGYNPQPNEPEPSQA